MESVRRLAAERGVALDEADQATLRRQTGTDSHQGCAALVEPFRYADLHLLDDRSGRRAVLMLDQIQDPQNLGALVRTAAAAGMSAVLIPRHGAVGVTAAVERASAGAVNDVPICRVSNLRNALRWLAERGYWSMVLTTEGGKSLFEIEIPERVVIVLGGESGVRPLLARSCDWQVSIPMRRGVESLNASVAGALAMYEVERRQPGSWVCLSG